MAKVAAVAGAALLLGGTAAGAVPREQPPQAPPERTQVIPFDLDAFARSIADLPDPLPAPPTDGSFQTCTKVGARPAAYPLFDGRTLSVPARRHAELCAVAGADGPSWTLSWSGVLQDPDVPGTGGWKAYGLWTLVGDDQGWQAALGNLDEGAQFTYRPADWDGVNPATRLVIDGRYLDRSTFPFEAPPPLEVEQTTTTTSAASPSTSGGTATPAQPVQGTPGYAG